MTLRQAAITAQNNSLGAGRDYPLDKNSPNGHKPRT